MPTNATRLTIVWCVGFVVGTSVIAATSPLFVRSYLAQQFDPVRQRFVPETASTYRWRSEGYANTRIGPHGMPGRVDVPSTTTDSIRVALWGDSQAEGVCVDDHQKLFAQIQQAASASGESMVVLPFARSGEDASHWLTQMPSVEQELEINVHVLMVVDLPDLHTADQAPVAFASERPRIESRSKLAARIPAFAIQAFRYLVSDANEAPRQLRFSLGPLAKPVTTPGVSGEVDWNGVWTQTMRTIRQSSDRPIVIVYAPISPSISFGTIELHDPWNEQFQKMERAAIAQNLIVVDTSDALGHAAREGRWPHGFHNGQIGSGHLNAVGYQVIAGQLVPAIINLIDAKE